MNITYRRLFESDICDINKIQVERGFMTIKNDIIPDGWVVYGAYDVDDIVAICYFFKYRRIPHHDYPTGYVAELGGAYTTPSHRHMGIMTELVKTMLANVHNDLFPCDTIMADSSDDAYPIYKKCGFEDSGEHNVWIKYY